MSNSEAWKNSCVSESPKEDYQITIEMTKQLDRMSRVDATDPDKIKARIDWYFDFASEHHIFPTLNGLALALGRDRSQVWRWSLDNNSERGRLIRQARQTVEEMLSQRLISCKGNAGNIIFALKQYGWKDVVTVETQPTISKLEDSLDSADEIVKRIQSDPDRNTTTLPIRKVVERLPDLMLEDER